MICVKLVKPIFVVGSSNFKKKTLNLIMKLQEILLAQIAPEKDVPPSVWLTYITTLSK